MKALIAARSGSLRVPNKNIRPFADSNLLTIKIRQLQTVRGLDGIIVNSNDKQILDIAKDLGCEVVKRDEKFASNTVSMSDVYVDMATNFNDDVIMYANCTNPLITKETIENCIHEYNNTKDIHDSLNTVCSMNKFMIMDSKPFNYDPKHQPRSQDLKTVLTLNFAISILSRELMIFNKNVLGNDPNYFVIDQIEGWDIDEISDFKIAECIYKAKMKNEI